MNTTTRQSLSKAAPQGRAPVRPELLKRERVSLRRRVRALEEKVALIERERALLAQLRRLNAGPELNALAEIEQAVCDEFKVHSAALQSSCRSAALCDARHVFFHLARQLTAFSLAEIGSFCGGRDHGTVLCGARRIAEQRRQPVEVVLNTHLERLEAALGHLKEGQ